MPDYSRYSLNCIFLGEEAWLLKMRHALIVE
jgi:hypothetical protein